MEKPRFIKNIEAIFKNPDFPPGQRSVVGDFINDAFIERRQEKERIKRLQEEREKAPGEVILVWSGTAGLEEVQNARRVISKRLGFEPRGLCQFGRNRKGLSPALYFASETLKTVEKGEKVSGVIVTDVNFSEGRKKVDSDFLIVMEAIAETINVPFHYIPANELYGSKDPKLVEEVVIKKPVRIEPSIQTAEIPEKAPITVYSVEQEARA